MADLRCSYDSTIAGGYDRRYRMSGLAGIAAMLSRIAASTRGRLGLEVGCGTGHWLAQVDGVVTVCGADLSPSMLAKAHAKQCRRLVAADAHLLPFPPGRFDLVWVVNALHHFEDPVRFVQRTVALLAPGGVLAVIGLDPGASGDDWYIYDYFTTTRATDLARYPSHEAVRGWMQMAGLVDVGTETAVRIQGSYINGEVFDAPILERHGTSQLCLLTDEEFEEGMERIRLAVQQADATGTEIVFTTDLDLPVTWAYRERVDASEVRESD